MPITQSTSLVSTISAIIVDMISGQMTVNLAQSADGLQVATKQVIISGQPFLDLLATQATAGQALGDEITLAIYNYAVSNAELSGVVS